MLVEIIALLISGVIIFLIYLAIVIFIKKKILKK
jgi:hypothetical protein